MNTLQIPEDVNPFKNSIYQEFNDGTNRRNTGRF